MKKKRLFISAITEIDQAESQIQLNHYKGW